MAKRRLGDILAKSGAISEEDLERAVREQRDRSIYLGEYLLEKSLVGKNQLAHALQEITNVPYYDCAYDLVDPRAVVQITLEAALKYCCVPVAMIGKQLIVVMAEPQNLAALDDLRFITGYAVSPRLGFKKDILATIKLYFPDAFPEETEPEGQVDEEPAPPADLGIDAEIEFISASSQQRAKDAIREFQAAMYNRPTEAVRMVTQVISTAILKRASDIHIDPQAAETVIRLRIDGILSDLTSIAEESAANLVSRVKILADLDIAERRMPQDGRFLVKLKGNKTDLRVATLPTRYGEKVVIRLLSPDSARAGFGDLGFSELSISQLTEALAQPQGMVLVCGPTGSGKSTTLYSALTHLSSRTVNIITVEDPVEYMIEGINQVQVNRKTGLTFASSLRSILRQDPNIVMVGEIRDSETAEIALTAAQTGHLVLSTLHTNDSISTIDRLKDLGIPTFLITSSVTAIVAQRLLRRLCDCRKKAVITDQDVNVFPELARSGLAQGVCAPDGCELCNDTGYRGRVGVYEVLSVNEEMRHLIQNSARTDDLRAWAATNGFRPMREDAVTKLVLGQTSISEIQRVVPLKRTTQLLCPKCRNVLQSSFVFCSKCGIRVAESEFASAF